MVATRKNPGLQVKVFYSNRMIRSLERLSALDIKTVRAEAEINDINAKSRD